jgi:ribokinase
VLSRLRIAVVGHLEWVEFVRVPDVPRAGEIAHGAPLLAVPGGGGAVAAVQLARFGAESVFFTALGNDALGHRARDEMQARGVRVHAVFRSEPQRRAITLIDAARERTIITVGERHAPHADDRLPWDELAGCDAVFITAGDAGAIRAARRARFVVATSRALTVLRDAHIRLDALVGSAVDPAERYEPGDLDVAPDLVVRTESEQGGHYVQSDGIVRRYAPVPAKVTGDTYGAGDTFAAGLTFALAGGNAPADALAFAAARAAEVVAFQGPYPPG